jgi:glc operon protein GlcG
VITEFNLDYAEAHKAIDAIVTEIARRGKAAIVVAADSHGELIALARMDGAPISSLAVASNKAVTAARTGRPSFDIGSKSRHPEQGYDISYYGDSRFCGWGGGVPVVKDGKVIGSLAVSGLPQEEDMEVVELGVTAIGYGPKSDMLSR